MDTHGRLFRIDGGRISALRCRLSDQLSQSSRVCRAAQGSHNGYLTPSTPSITTGLALLCDGGGFTLFVESDGAHTAVDTKCRSPVTFFRRRALRDPDIESFSFMLSYLNGTRAFRSKS